ncbi:MAG: histidine phosphatase family protein [Thermoleophilia bacterium]
MTVLLLRHGETDWNCEPVRCQGWAHVGLNRRGRDQAREVGRLLRDRGLELVVTSHLVRARETAAILLEEIGGVRLVSDPRLAETHRGDWEAHTYRSVMVEEPEDWRRYREDPATFRFPAGESLVEQQLRVLAAVRDVLREARPAVLVAHGGSIRLVRCFAEDLGIEAFHSMSPGTCSLVEIATDGLLAKIERFLG